jgi:malonyl-CoA/methylmalonyl-CoA synthetase
LSLALVGRAEASSERTALITAEGVFSYADLLETSDLVATRLLAGRDDLEGARVCMLIPPGWDYVATLWGVWRAGGVAVPLATSHPAAELAHVLDDASPEIVVAHPALLDRIEEAATSRGLSVLQTPALTSEGPVGQLPDVPTRSPSMMLYTSGTTGKPKGVVLTHANIEAQVESLSEAWGWSEDDHILLHLPLHHVHGIVNVLTSALWNGATCEILPRFTPVDVWERLNRGDVTVYMAVPTVYHRLIEAWGLVDPETREVWSAGARACRLNV